MSQVVKTFMGIFLILFMIVTSIGILTAYLQVMNAQDLQARIVDEIENSDYAAEVVKGCFDQSTRYGYSLQLTYYFENGGTVCVKAKDSVPSDVESIAMARVELSFPFQVGFLNINKAHTFTSYAR